MSVRISWDGNTYQISAVLKTRRECQHVIRLASLIADQLGEDEAKRALSTPEKETEVEPR